MESLLLPFCPSHFISCGLVVSLLLHGMIQYTERLCASARCCKRHFMEMSKFTDVGYRIVQNRAPSQFVVSENVNTHLNY